MMVPLLTNEYTDKFNKAIAEEIEAGNIIAGEGGIYEFDYGVLAVKGLAKGVTLGDIARNIVPKTKGMISTTQTGLTYIYGKYGVKGRLLMKSGIPAILEAREAYKTFTGEYPASYSVSSVARKFLSGLTPVKWHGSDERLMPDNTWHFQHCIPGEYSNVTVIDCKSYYYQLLKRVNTLEVHCTVPGRLNLPRTNPNDMAYFRDMVEVIANAKMLRNTIVGCMSGGGDPLQIYCYRKGEVEKFYRTPEFGPFRGLGLLIVATGAELTKNACLHSGAIYGNIDCAAVTSKGRIQPFRGWDEYGIVTEVKAEGSGEFCHIGSWSTGDFMTIPYKTNNRVYLTTKGEYQTVAKWASQWL